MKKVIFLLCCHLMPLHGQDILDSDLRLAGKVLREVFVEQKKALNDWSVAIYGGENGRLASLFGTVVSSDGYILTKASDFQKIENVSLRVGGEKIEKYATVAVSEVWDVLLLKIEAEGLSAVELDEEADLSVGTWVISNGGTSRRERRAKAGIISANSRQIASKDRPFIGIIVDREAEVDGLLLKDTSEGAGAREAGLKKGDIIKKLGDYELKDFSDLIDSLSGKKVGAIVEIEFDRDGEKKAVQVELKSRSEVLKEKVQRDRNDRLSGRYSERRDKFPLVLQHATLLSPKSMGGPLIHLNGKCVGMNIAYANRSESYAIPAKELRWLMTEMIKEAKNRHNRPIENSADTGREEETEG